MARGGFYGSSIVVEGLRDVTRAVERSDGELDDWLRGGLNDIAEAVAVDVRSAYSVYSGIGAEHVKAKVTRPGNAIVAQTLRRGRDLNRRRPNFGGLMMRKAFLPALHANEATVEASWLRLSSDLEQVWR